MSPVVIKKMFLSGGMSRRVSFKFGTCEDSFIIRFYDK
jgi:hypothetical protein